MRSRTKKRVALVLSLLVVGAVGLTGAYFARQYQKQASAERALERGLAAYEAEEWEGAVEGLGAYVGRDGSDDEILLKFAESLRAAPGQDGRRIRTAVQTARVLAERETGEVGPGTELLMELYAQLGQASELAALTEEVLALDPEHLEAASLRVWSLQELGRSDEALTEARRLSDEYPADAMMQALYFRVASRVGGQEDEIVSRARALIESSEVGPLLVGAQALAASGFVEEAAVAVDEVLSAGPEGPAVLRGVLALSDGLASGYPELSRRAVEAVRARYAESGDGALRRLLVLRAWKRGEVGLVGLYARDIASAPAEAATDELGVVLLAEEAGEFGAAGEDVVDVAAVRSELASRAGGDVTAGDWETLLGVYGSMRSGERDDAREQLRVLTTAGRGFLSEVAELVLASLLAELGESDAVAAGLESLTSDPSWRRARLMLAQVYQSSGRHDDAIAVLMRDPSLQRWEQGVRALTRSAIARARSSSSSEVDRSFALELTREYLTVLGPDPTSLALRGRALLAAGRPEEAVATARELLALGEAGLGGDGLSFASELRVYDAELSERLASLYGGAGESAFGAAMSRVNGMFASGDLPGALEALRSVEVEAGTLEAMRVRIAEARVLERLGDDGAGDAFESVAADFPGEGEAQLALLDSSSGWEDLDAAGRAIARLRDLTGESGTKWRVYGARHRLVTDESEAAASRALIDLTRVVREERSNVQALVLAAEAAERLGDRDGAAGYLERAVEADPRRVDLYPSLIVSLQTAGRSLEAEEALVRFAALPAETLERARGRASLLERQGMLEEALRDRRWAAERGDRMDALALARVLAQLGDGEARSVLAEARSGGDLSPEETVRVSEVLLELGEGDEALAVLHELPEQSEAGSREALVGAALARLGRLNESATALERAIESNPEDYALRLRLVRALISSGRLLDARAAAERAAAVFPSEETLRGIVSVLDPDGEHASLRATIAFAMSDADSGEASTALRGLLLEYADDLDDLDGLIAELASHNGAHPGHDIAWRVRTEALLAKGLIADAVEVARASVGVATDGGGAAEWAGRLALASGRADLALTLGERWREFAGSRRAEADAFVARAALAADRPAVAVAATDPYVGFDGFGVGDGLLGDLGRRRVAALAAVGRVDDAAGLLERLDDGSTDWGVTRARAAAGIAGEDPSRARSWLEEAEASGLGGTATGRATLAGAWDALARRTGSRDDFESAAAVIEGSSGDELAVTEGLVGGALLVLGRLEESEAAFRRALEVQPDQPDLLNNVAYLTYRRGGDLSEAKAFAGRAIETGRAQGAPGSKIKEFYDTLGLVELGLGNASAAESAFREGLGLDPRAANLSVGLAEALEAQGRAEEARRVLNGISAELAGALAERANKLRQRL